MNFTLKKYLVIELTIFGSLFPCVFPEISGQCEKLLSTCLTFLVHHIVLVQGACKLH